jgi:hypothetical protein
VLIRTAADLASKPADQGYSGAWVGDRKLAAIGVASRWVTTTASPSTSAPILPADLIVRGSPIAG